MTRSAAIGFHPQQDAPANARAGMTRSAAIGFHPQQDAPANRARLRPPAPAWAARYPKKNRRRPAPVQRNQLWFLQFSAAAGVRRCE